MENIIISSSISTADFNRLSSFILQQFGIKLPPVKKTMLQGRLQKRLRAMDMTSFKEYIDFVLSEEGKKSELIHMIDVVTTNKTDFFRENNHFEFLQESVLPEFMQKTGGREIFKIWSAGCSSGEEPYTMAIVLQEFANTHPGFQYRIYATDISTQVLEKAALAIYPLDRINVVPLAMKKKYFLKSKDKSKPTVRLVPELRNKISFQRLNFMESHYKIEMRFDAIFCRNVLIYFDKNTQEKVIGRQLLNLKPGAHYFLGHSESIMNMNLPLVQIKPTIFRKK
jgi:chemotaxis protein methyltransferase CheR